jgi:hypothetical protein
MVTPFFSKFRLIIILFGVQLLTSCAVYNGNITGNAQLGSNNFRYVGKVSASNKCVYVFHWGGNAKETQITALKNELQQRYPLRNGLAWANVSLEMKTGFYILWDVRKAILTADIVDFWPDTNTAFPAYNGYYLNDTTFIPVPQKMETYTVASQDSLTPRLMFMNARKQPVDIKKLSQQKRSEILINSEVIFLRNEKSYLGIVISVDYEYFTAVVAFLDEFGKLKIVKGDMRRFFIYTSQ